MKHIEAPVERTVCQLTGTVTDRGRCTTTSLAAEASGDRPEAVKRPDNHYGAPTSGHFFRTPPGAVDDPAAVIPPTAAGSPTPRK